MILAQMFSLSAGFSEKPEISVVFPLMKEMDADMHIALSILNPTVLNWRKRTELETPPPPPVKERVPPSLNQIKLNAFAARAPTQV